MTQAKIDALKLACTLLIVMGLYALTMPRYITFEDAGMFQQVCHFGGIAHPPGYPLFTLICTPLFLLPFDPILIGNLISVTFATLTLGTLYFVLVELGLNANFRCLTVLIAAFGVEFWSQALIIEVYTFNTFLLLGLLLTGLLFHRTRELRWMWLGAIITGLSLSNHWPITLLSLTGISLLFLPAISREPAKYLKTQNVAGCSLLVVLGLTPYLIMFLKPPGTFGYSGEITDIRNLVEYISRSAYTEVDTSSHADFSDKLSFAQWFIYSLFNQYGWPFGIVALIGLVQGLRSNALIHCALLIVAVSNSFLLIALLGFEFNFQYVTAFSHYPIMTYLCWATWAGLGIQCLWAALVRNEPLRKAAGGLVLTILLVSTGVIGYNTNNRSDITLAEAFANSMFDALPQGSILVIDSDAHISALGYKRHVEGKRRDIDIYEWENAFTFNKLPPNRIEHLQQLAGKRPVFSIEISELPRAEEFPLFQSVSTSQGLALASKPKTLTLFQNAALNYQNGKYRYGADLTFAHQLLISAGNYLFHRVNTSSATPEEVETLIVVQRTFPGAIAVASMAMSTNSNILTKDSLLTLLEPHESNLPLSAMPAEKVNFYIMLSKLKPREQEERYIALAAAAQPDQRNPAWCFLNQGKCQVR